VRVKRTPPDRRIIRDDVGFPSPTTRLGCQDCTGTVLDVNQVEPLIRVADQWLAIQKRLTPEQPTRSV
jgi:hypothetical protein